MAADSRADRIDTPTGPRSLEYFYGGTGLGQAASHQTGRTGPVALLTDKWRR